MPTIDIDSLVDITPQNLDLLKEMNKKAEELSSKHTNATFK